MLHAVLSAFVVALAALAAVGCGESSKSSASATSAVTTTTSASASTPALPAVKIATGRPLSRAKWIADGDAICAHVNREVAVISIRSQDEYARFLPQIAVYYKTEVGNLSKLVPPPPMAKDAAQLVGGLQLLSEYLIRSGQAFQTGDASSGSRLFREAVTVQRQPIAVARRDGFKKCTATN